MTHPDQDIVSATAGIQLRSRTEYGQVVVMWEDGIALLMRGMEPLRGTKYPVVVSSRVRREPNDFVGSFSWSGS